MNLFWCWKLCTAHTPAAHELVLVLETVHGPLRQEGGPWTVDLGGWGRHVCVGGAGSKALLVVHVPRKSWSDWGRPDLGRRVPVPVWGLILSLNEPLVTAHLVPGQLTLAIVLLVVHVPRKSW